MDRKKEIDRLAKFLAKSNSQDNLAVRELLAFMILDAKDSLVTATGEGTIRLQGYTQALIAVERHVSVLPPSINTERMS